MFSKMMQALEETPIIAAVKNEDELQKAILTNCGVIFLLFGDVCTVSESIKKIKDSDKIAIVHIDLIEGLEKKPIALNFIKTQTLADGIISTKQNMVKFAKEMGFITVQRCFLIDSMALKTVKKHIDLGVADFVEILPGVMPKVIKNIASNIKVPLIAGGLILDKEDVILALGAGATAVSTTLADIWDC